MNNDTTKTTVYVLWTGTFKQALEECCGEDKEIFRWKNPDVTEPRKDVYDYQIRPTLHWSFYYRHIEALVQKIVLPRIFSDGYTGNVAEKALEMALDSPATFGFTLKGDEVSNISQLGIRDADHVYITDIDTIKQALRDKRVNPYGAHSPADKTPIETVTAIVGGQWRPVQRTDIMTRIKKELRKNYTYCLKNGKSIVPPEYAKRGGKGIAEWRQLKSKQNKANSLDKQIIKQTLRQTKNDMDKCLNAIFSSIERASNADWTVPRLRISGQDNQQRRRGQVSTLLKGHSKNDIMKMDKQTVLNLAKEYWKNELKQAYDAVDKLKVEDINF